MIKITLKTPKYPENIKTTKMLLESLEVKITKIHLKPPECPENTKMIQIPP
jgi:hypothetical protein